MPEIQRLGSGATFAEVSKTDLENFEIGLPGILDQRKIASNLANQMAAVERSRAAAEARLNAVKALPTSWLRLLSSSQEAQQWPKVPLRELLLEPIKTGISKRTSPTSNRHCLTLSAVRGGYLDLSATKTVDVSEEEAEGNWIRSGAFYVVRGNGNQKLVGRGAFAPSNLNRRILYPDLLFQVLTDPGVILPKFLGLIWESQEVRRQIENRSRTSAGIHKINQANLGEIALRIPPIEMQRRVAAMLNEKLDTLSTAVHRLENESNCIGALPAALLRRAFSGEL